MWLITERLNRSSSRSVVNPLPVDQGGYYVQGLNLDSHVGQVNAVCMDGHVEGYAYSAFNGLTASPGGSPLTQTAASYLRHWGNLWWDEDARSTYLAANLPGGFEDW